MIHGYDGFSRAQWVMSGGDLTAGDDLQAFGMFTEPHGHLGWIVSDLKPFDLQVMFRMTKAAIARFISIVRIFRDLAQHALIKLRFVARHAGLRFGAATDRAIHEEIEIHGVRSLTKHRFSVRRFREAR